MTTTNLSKADRRRVREAYLVYRNTGSVGTGKWVYQPHDFDGSFELWSDVFDTRREAYAAAFAELSNPCLA